MTDSKHDGQGGLEGRTKALFDESVAALDAATRSKLAAARARALEETRSPALLPGWLTEKYAAVAATLAVAVVAGWLSLSGPDSSDPMMEPIADVDDFELLLEADELEMLEELEFFAWLDEQPDVETSADAFEGPPDDGAG